MNEYNEHLVRERGFESNKEYREHLANQKGFELISEYEKHLANERQQRLANQKLSGLVKQKLEELGQSQRWLSQQLEITEGAVSRYISGKTLPKKVLQKKCSRFLDCLPIL